MSALRYVCRPCLVSFRPKQNNVYLEERSRHADGSTHPYRLWAADLLACPKCGAEIVAGFAKMPLAEAYEPEYANLATMLPLLGAVED